MRKEAALACTSLKCITTCEDIIINGQCPGWSHKSDQRCNLGKLPERNEKQG
jgi:hypothetical protein